MQTTQSVIHSNIRSTVIAAFGLLSMLLAASETAHAQGTPLVFQAAGPDATSIQGAVDHLRGLKENVIVGRLIPAGTGMEYYRNVRLSPEMEEAAAKVQEEVSQAYEEAERALELMRTEGETEELTAE